MMLNVLVAREHQLWLDQEDNVGRWYGTIWSYGKTNAYNGLSEQCMKSILQKKI